MNWYIRRVVIYGKNREIRDMEFGPGVNIVTGDSKKGKSAILQIADYCLGSSECNIPAGAVREFASAYGLLLQTPTEQIFLARPDPGIRTTASEMLLRVQPVVSIPKHEELVMMTNRDAVITELSSRLGLMQMKLAEDEDDRDFSGRPSIRDLTAFIFQPQTVIDDNKMLFYRLEDPGYRRRLERIFPLVLGAVDESYFRLRTAVDDQKKLAQRLERELQRALTLVGEGLAKARDLYRQAEALNLVQESLQDSWGFVELSDRLEKVAAVRSNADMDHGVAELHGDKLAGLEAQFQSLRADLSVIDAELAQVYALDKAVSGYVDALETHNDRLTPLGLFSGNYERAQCPLCHQGLSHLSGEIRQLKTTSERLHGQLMAMKTAPPALDQYRKKLQGDLRAKAAQLKTVNAEIRSNRSTQARLAAHDKLESIVHRYLGRVDYYLEHVAEVQNDSALQQRVSQEKARLLRLQESLSHYDHQARLDAALRVVGRHMTAVAATLDLEWPNPALALDLKRMTVVCDTPSGQPVFLLHMGSAANWVGCHLSALLGLHRFFADLDNSPVPSILFIDQASQAYFPSDARWDGGARDTDRENVRKIFQTVFDTVALTGHRLQVIMIDHADYDDWPEFTEAVGDRRFRGDRALI